MQSGEVYGLIGAVFSGLVCLDYIISVLKNRTRPHAFTWGLWALVTGIVAVAQWQQGAGPGSWPAAASTFYCVAIFILSLFKGEPGLTSGDWISLSAGLAIIPIWYVTNQALLAVLLSTMIDACAYYPTIRKSWIRPHEEKISMYASDNGRWIFALLATQNFSLTTLLYPVFCLVANNSLALMIYWRRKSLGAESTAQF